jgi:hypothetical protein
MSWRKVFDERAPAAAICLNCLVTVVAQLEFLFKDFEESLPCLGAGCAVARLIDQEFHWKALVEAVDSGLKPTRPPRSAERRTVSLHLPELNCSYDFFIGSTSPPRAPPDERQTIHGSNSTLLRLLCFVVQSVQESRKGFNAHQFYTGLWRSQEL